MLNRRRYTETYLKGLHEFGPSLLSFSMIYGFCIGQSILSKGFRCKNIENKRVLYCLFFVSRLFVSCFFPEEAKAPDWSGAFLKPRLISISQPVSILLD